MLAEVSTWWGTSAEGECDAGQGQQQRGNPKLDPGVRRPAKSWSVPGWHGGGEKVGEQVCDALSLVVVHPVRGVGQALDAVREVEEEEEVPGLAELARI
jgi:hypothetical protein